MNLAFTICSNNYLAQAKTLGDSLLKHNPGHKFIIVLVDRKTPQINYGFFEPHELVLIEDVGIRDFENIWKKYNLVELNTAVKPSLFKYFFKKYAELDNAFYFDPDIMIFRSLGELETEFEDADILLTPHINSPIEFDGLVPSENTFLNFGLYNLGFIGLKNRSTQTSSFLDWWEKRSLEFGFIDACNGIFVDQLWVNLAPLFFKKVKTLRQMGYNAAPWNLHERRKIQKRGDEYMMPDQSKLTFYHFSSYSYAAPGNIARNYNRFKFSDCEEIKPIYDEYLGLLLANKIEQLSKHNCYFVERREKYLLELEAEIRKKGLVRRKAKQIIKGITPPFIWEVVKKALA